MSGGHEAGAGERRSHGGRRRRLTAAGSSIGALCLAALLATSASAVTPEITLTTFSGVTSESAVLEAEVNPKGKAAQYHFEYGPADCSSNPCTATVNAPISSGTSPVAVQAPVTGLTPGDTYHFRIVVKNPESTADGPDAVFTTHTLRPPFAPCANDAFRSKPPQPSEALPDCRAYEQASPVAKNGIDARARVSFAKASLNGDRISFSPAGGMPGSEGGQNMPIYLSSRTGGNWSTQGLMPPAGVGERAEVAGWSTDFSEVFDTASKFNRVGNETLIARSSTDGSLATIVPYGSGLKDPVYAAASADGSKVLFESESKLPSVPASLEGRSNLYLWDRDSGTLSLAGVLNGEPTATAPPGGAFAGSYDWIGGTGLLNLSSGGAAIHYLTTDQHVISADGRSVYFTAGKTGQLYLRRNPTRKQSPLDGQGRCTDPALACTLQVSASRRTSPDPAGTRPAAFLGATPDGSSAFFTSSEKLTDDANTGPEQQPASIARAKALDGGEKKLDHLLADAKGIATDATYIYWADPVQGTIGRAKLDGGEVKKAFIAEAGRPQYVTVDAEHLYWTDAEHEGKEEGTIGRANIDGSEVKSTFITGATDPQGIDAEGEHLYWGNAGEEDTTRTIGRAKLGGGEAEEVEQGFIEVGGGATEITPQGVAVNGTRIYFAASATQKLSFIVSYDIDGEPASRKFFFHDEAGEGVRGIALDSTHVYWARQGKDTIGRAKLDFTEPEPEWIKEAAHPLGLAVNASDIFWSANQESPPNPGNDLYRYDAGSGKLSDLAVGPGPRGADVLGVLGTSEDGSAVYFAANGDLDGAGPATEGDCEGAVSANAPDFSGQCNLYLAREGSPVSFIAPLDASAGRDAFDWVPRGLSNQSSNTARVSADGRTLLFRSQNQLTPYDNEGVPEFYRYHTGEGITCVSCNPSGEAPSGAPDLGSINLSAMSAPATSEVLSRNLSADGTEVFFETTDALVGEDTNGLGGCPLVGPSQGEYRICLDVYEWEAQGAGSCGTQGGCLYLLSSGRSPDASYLADASASGEDVFIITRSQLVRQDEDQLYDVYDARVEGGLAAQNEVRPTPCEGVDACHLGEPPSPAFEGPGTAGFTGPPNPRPKHARKAKKARHGKGRGHRRKGKGHHGRARTSGRAGG